MKQLKTIQRNNRKRRTKAKLHIGEKPILVVYKSLTNNYAQLVDSNTNKTLIGTSDLKIKKGSKMERAKIVGEEMAKKAIAKKIHECVFNRNGYKYHGRIKAIAEGAREGGLKF